MAYTDFNSEESNVLVYMEDEGFCFMFKNDNIFEDLDWMAELFFTGEYREARYVFEEDYIQYFDRFYRINSYDKSRIKNILDMINNSFLGDNFMERSRKVEIIKGLNIGPYTDVLINEIENAEKFELEESIEFINETGFMSDEEVKIFEEQLKKQWEFKKGFA